MSKPTSTRERMKPRSRVTILDEPPLMILDEPPEPAADLDCRDELNLAEFPIAALADRVPDDQLTLVFEDRLEQRDGPPIVRRLTITGNPKDGLPTALDDEVLVGLIQLTKRRSNFTDAKVNFSRYELIELLGWPQSGASYQRIEEALNRWVGVVLRYENAWWDNAAKSWVDETFHILDNVTLYDRERQRLLREAKRRGRAGVEAPLPLSSFRWNEVIFRSFQAGNLKQLDLEFFVSLKLPTNKRMYRFLDKRFYRRERLEFDLKTFACNHIGMSKSYPPTEMKRRLRPALVELEEKGFLEPLGLEERYSYQGKGQWRIVFMRGSYGRDDGRGESEPEAAELIAALTKRGVGERAATRLVARAKPSRVRTKIEVFDWLVENGDRRVAKNAAGYLVSSIKADYEEPSEYAARAEAAARYEAQRRAAEAERRKRAEEEAAARAAAAREAALKARWDALQPAQRDAIMAKMKAEHPELRRWKSMLMPFCLEELERLIQGRKPIPSMPGQGSLFG